MENKFYTINEVFENSSFKTFAPFFLEGKRTISDIARESKISRTTIIELLKSIEPYVISPKWSAGVKGRPVSFDSKILSDYLANKLELEVEQKKVLGEIVINPSINPIIVKNNENIDTCISKVLLTVLLMSASFSDEEIAKNTNFTADFLFRIFMSRTHKSSKRKEKSNFTNKKVEFTFEDNEFGVSKEEFEKWKLEVHRYAKRFNNDEDLWGLTEKVRSLDIPIVTSPEQWHEIFCMTIPALTHYSDYVTRSAKKDYENKRKFGTKDEKRVFADIEKQLGHLRGK